MTKNHNLSIVGCGLSGLSLAKELKEYQEQMLLLDKARGPGGRTCTRRFEDQRLDHGVVSLFAEEEPFKSALASWSTEGVLREWFSEDKCKHYAAASGISALPKHLIKDFNVELQQRIVKIESSNKGLELVSESGETFSCKLLALTCPAPQIIELLSNSPAVESDEIERKLAEVHYEKCLAAMVLTDSPVDLGPSGIVRNPNENFGTVFNNQIKQGKEGPPALTFHFSENFSDRNFELSNEEREDVIRKEIEQFLGSDNFKLQTHRWRYSVLKDSPFSEPVLIKRPFPVVITGEAFSKIGVQAEAAWNSGLAAARLTKDLLDAL